MPAPHLPASILPEAKAIVDIAAGEPPAPPENDTLTAAGEPPAPPENDTLNLKDKLALRLCFLSGSA